MFQLSHSKLWAVASGSSHLTYKGEMILVFVESRQEGIMEDKKYMFCDCLYDGLSLSCLVAATFSLASICMSLRLQQFKCCNMSPRLDGFCCLLNTNLEALSWKVNFAFIVGVSGRTIILK